MNFHREETLKEQERLIRLQPMVEMQLKVIAGVDHVGVGVKEIKGQLSSDLCFRVYVKEKKPEDHLLSGQVIPSSILGVKTDVLTRSEVLGISDRSRHRPLRGGIQLRTERVDGDDPRLAGTLGALVTSISSSSGKLMALTCQHVVAEGVHAPANPNASVGMKVGQPTYSTCCCCVCGDIGSVFKVQKDTNVDCALIDLKANLVEDISSSSMQNHIEGIGAITGVAQAVCFEHVRKRGAGTEITEGNVVEVMFDGSQILVRPINGTMVFADFGDSGAVLVNDANKIIGLLWAANRNVTHFPNSSSSGTFFRKEGVANHIGPVMSALGITIGGQNSSGLLIPSANCGPVFFPPSSGRSSSSSRRSSSSSSGSSRRSSSLSSGSSRRSSSSSSSSSRSSSCGASPNHRDYVGMNKSVVNAIGFRARITTRRVVLPCEPAATFAAFSTTWVGLVNSLGSATSGDWVWAQMGFSTDRVAGSAAVTYKNYCEINGGAPFPTNYHMKWLPSSANGAHVFSAEVTQPPIASSSSSSSSSGRPATGEWKFYLDGTEVHHFASAAWARRTGTILGFNTELQDHQSPVPGTSASRCVFDQCAYKTRGSANFTNAGLVAANLKNDDPARHSIRRINGTSFESWER